MSSAGNERQSTISGQTKVSSRAQSVGRRGIHVQGESMQPVDDFVHYLTEYARNNPGSAALWCLGIGFVLGWKLKPW